MKLMHIIAEWRLFLKQDLYLTCTGQSIASALAVKIGAKPADPVPIVALYRGRANVVRVVEICVGRAHLHHFNWTTPGGTSDKHVISERAGRLAHDNDIRQSYGLVRRNLCEKKCGQTSVRVYTTIGS